MTVGESVKNCALWDTRRPPRGNSALPSMGAQIDGPYNTPSTGGIIIVTAEEKLEHKERSLVGDFSKGSKEGSSQGELRHLESPQGATEQNRCMQVATETPVTWEEHPQITCPLAV
jgi:hypothetical protein